MQHKQPCSYCRFPCFWILDLGKFITKTINMPVVFGSFHISCTFIVEFRYKRWSCTQLLLKATGILLWVYLFSWDGGDGNSVFEPLTYLKALLFICPKFLIFAAIKTTPSFLKQTNKKPKQNNITVKSPVLSTNFLKITDMDFQLERNEVW